MAKKPKLSKISIVVFLTILIWVWADLAQDERMSLSGYVTITMARPNDPTIWASFEGSDSALRPSITIDAIDLKGPASRVTEVERMKKKGELTLDLFASPEEEGWTEVGPASFDVLNFLKQSAEIRQLGLTVESCEPRSVAVAVRRLVPRPLPVRCVDENGDAPEGRHRTGNGQCLRSGRRRGRAGSPFIQRVDPGENLRDPEDAVCRADPRPKARSGDPSDRVSGDSGG